MSKELFPHFFLPHFFKQNYSRNADLSIACEGIKLSPIGRDSFESLFFRTRLLNCSMTWFDNNFHSRRTMFCFRLRAMLHGLETFVLFSIKLFIQRNFGYHRELIATGRLLVFKIGHRCYDFTILQVSLTLQFILHQLTLAFGIPTNE